MFNAISEAKKNLRLAEENYKNRPYEGLNINFKTFIEIVREEKIEMWKRIVNRLVNGLNNE